MRELRLLEQNFVLISGNVVADPDFRVTQSGTALCNFRVAVNRRFKDNKTGEWKDDTAWVSVDVWREAAERLRDRLKKGSPVHIEGRLKTDEWTDKQSGQKRSTLKVVARRVQFLGKLSSGEGQPASGKPAADLEEVPF